MAHGTPAAGGITDLVHTLPLVDHHCHGLVRRDLDRDAFESLLTESDGPSPLGTSLFDSHIGLAVRRWCAPVLGLRPHASPDDYLTRRNELGWEEVARRLLGAAGLAAVCVDTGVEPEPLLSPAELARATGPEVRAYEVVRLERLADELLSDGTAPGDFAQTFRDRLAERTQHSTPGAAARPVAVKSIAAYRTGLELPGERPGDNEVTSAAARALAGGEQAARVADPVLHSFLVWSGIDLGLPVQFHVGYGDNALHLARANPLLLTDLLRASQDTTVPVMLLHNYPYHREAAYLAQVFPHVFVDVGLTVPAVGARSAAVLGERLEVAPFGKVLYSSDAYCVPELFHLGATLFRTALSRLLETGIGEDAWTDDDARHLAALVTADNAVRAYRLPA